MCPLIPWQLRDFLQARKPPFRANSGSFMMLSSAPAGSPLTIPHQHKRRPHARMRVIASLGDERGRGEMTANHCNLSKGIPMPLFGSPLVFQEKGAVFIPELARVSKIVPASRTAKTIHRYFSIPEADLPRLSLCLVSAPLTTPSHTWIWPRISLSMIAPPGSLELNNS